VVGPPGPNRQTAAELPVRRIPVGMPAGPSGALYLLGGPPADDEARDALVEQFVTLAAQLVENAVRHEESHQELAWRQALADVSQVLLRPSGDDETQVWQHIADHVQTLTRARTVTISAPSEDDPELLQVVVAAGLGRDQLPGLRFRRSGSLSQLAMSTRTSQTGTADGWTVSHTSVEPRAPLGPLLAIPLVGTGPPRGAIVLSREADRPPFSPRDITVAQDFATQATLALELAETRASQVVLQARTELEQVSDSPQDQVIQRLFALGLTLDRAAREDPQTWVDQARAEVAEAIAEARGSLRTDYGLDRPDGGSV
jgi:two-component system, NarL family, sensor histidine kinase DevS